MKKVERMLRFIGRNNGVRLRDIQKFVLKMCSMPNTRDQRGWWSSVYYGNRYGNVSVLKRYCEKRDNKWFLIKPIKGPYFVKRILPAKEIADLRRIFD